LTLDFVCGSQRLSDGLIQGECSAFGPRRLERFFVELGARNGDIAVMFGPLGWVQNVADHFEPRLRRGE
jgi:hypothetical protein